MLKLCMQGEYLYMSMFILVNCALLLSGYYFAASLGWHTFGDRL